MKNIFIAGESGSVGLKIKEITENHSKIKVISASESFSKLSQAEIQNIIQDSSLDLMFLALPEEISEKIIKIQKAVNQTLKIIDCSALNRTNPEWTYGLPELNPEQKNKIKQAQLVANPGCHATGAILAIQSVLATKIFRTFYYPISIHSLTGHSGGGKKEITKYHKKPDTAPIAYSLNQHHKHLEEIKHFFGIKQGINQISLTPVKVNTPIGMIVESTFFNVHHGFAQNAVELISNYYQDSSFIEVKETPIELLLTENIGTNKVTLFVHHDIGNYLIRIHAVLDNLMKGSAGAAIQNMNLMLGFDETEGLK